MNFLKMLVQRPLGILLSFGVVCIFFAFLIAIVVRFSQQKQAEQVPSRAPTSNVEKPLIVPDAAKIAPPQTSPPAVPALVATPKPAPESPAPAPEVKPEAPAPAVPNVPGPQTSTAPAPAVPMAPPTEAPQSPNAEAPKKDEASPPAETPAPAPMTPPAEAPKASEPESPKKEEAAPAPTAPAPVMEAPKTPAVEEPAAKPEPAKTDASSKETSGKKPARLDIPQNPLSDEAPPPEPEMAGPPPPDVLQELVKNQTEKKEGSPKDVTGSKAATRDMEGKNDTEFDKEAAEANTAPLPEIAEKPAAKTNVKPNGKTSPKDRNEMTGWELRRYQDRDYITANSIHRFYRFNNLSIEGKNVWFRSPVLILKATLGSQDLLINNIKFVLSYPVVEIDGKVCFSRLDLCKLIDPVLRPSYIGTAGVFDTVIIDAGHGGHDSGAKGIYGYEKDFTLKLAMLLKRVLERQGLKVVMTRSTDVFISLSGRVAIANKVPNSIYISLHFNSGDSTSATGIETFALSPQGASSVYGARSVDYLAFQGNQRDSENIALATAVHASVVHHFKLVDRGVKRARWHVLTGLQRPGILFEGGFVTSPNDGRLIAAENFRSEMAATIGQAIMNYRRALQPKTAR